jgi:hypothetical protein
MSSSRAGKPYTEVEGRREIRSFVLREGRADAYARCPIGIARVGERPRTDARAGATHHGWFT